MSSKKLLVANWKMNLGMAESEALAEQVIEDASSLRRSEVWIAPPVITLPLLLCRFRNRAVRLGSQNVHWDTKGAFTGEISRPSLEELGCSFAIVGHSERRHLLGESNEIAARRARGALTNEFTIIACVGETAAQHRGALALDTITSQIAPIVDGLDRSLLSSLVIAYEPVWAVGTGVVPTAPEIEAVHAHIAALCERAIGAAPPILYGGSVTAANLEQILSIPRVAGVLVGGATLRIETFRELIKIAERSQAE